MALRKDLVGVGGWLAFLIAGLTVLGPFLGAARLLTEQVAAEQSSPQLLQSSLWASFKLSYWVIFSIASAISVSAGIALKTRHRPSTVAYAVACLWVSGPIAGFANLAAAVLFFEVEAVSKVLPEMIGGITGTAALAGAWTAYLLMSARVRNTYYAAAIS